MSYPQLEVREEIQKKWHTPEKGKNQALKREIKAIFEERIGVLFQEVFIVQRVSTVSVFWGNFNEVGRGPQHGEGIGYSLRDEELLSGRRF